MKIGLFHGSKLDQIYLCSIDKSCEKGDFENPKVINRNFSTKSVPLGHKNRNIWGVPVLSNLDLHSFCFQGLFLNPHINSVNQGMPVLISYKISILFLKEN
jgi:hypothetical protein